jgi:hypothetical protein
MSNSNDPNATHLIDSESFKRLEKKVDDIDAKLTTLLSLVMDTKDPDEIDAASILVRQAIKGLTASQR